MLEVQPFLFNSDGCVEPEKEKRKKSSRNAAVGGFFVASSPFFQQYLHALNHFISGLFSLHSSWSESMNAAGRIVDKRTMALFVKTKQTGYISVYYNVASQDKANYLPHPPPRRDSLCYSHHFALWWIKDFLVLFLSLLEVLVETTSEYISSEHLEIYIYIYIHSSFSNISLWLVHSENCSCSGSCTGG